jgi:hypothetical protein
MDPARHEEPQAPLGSNNIRHLACRAAFSGAEKEGALHSGRARFSVLFVRALAVATASMM